MLTVDKIRRMTGRAGSVVATAARSIVAAAVLLVLAACGQKGPLIAVKPASAVAPPADAPSAPVYVAPSTASAASR